MRVRAVPYISVRKRRARIAMLDAISFSIGFRFLSFVFPGLNFCHLSIAVPAHPRDSPSFCRERGDHPPSIGETTRVQVRVHGKTYAGLLSRAA